MANTYQKLQRGALREMQVHQQLIEAEKAMRSAACLIETAPEVLTDDEIRKLYDRLKRDGKFLARCVYPRGSVGEAAWDGQHGIRRPR